MQPRDTINHVEKRSPDEGGGFLFGGKKREGRRNALQG